MTFNPLRQVPRGCDVALMCLVLSAIPSLAQPTRADEIPDDRYVTVTDDGHLQQGGERVRYWGFIGHMVGGGINLPADITPEQKQERVDGVKDELRQMVDRIDTLGFNLVRSWEGGYGKQSAFIFEADYEKGEGSRSDLIAYYFDLLDQKGIKLWMSGINTLGAVEVEDVDVIDEPDTAAAWSAAIREMREKHGKPLDLRHSALHMTRFFDPRTETVMIQRMRKLADFPNHYKGGLRMGDDPQIAVWEITNEEFIFRDWFNGKWQKLPAFFQDQLFDHWHAFLREKYGDDAGLVKAWKFVLEGESLADGTVALLPLASPTQPAAALNDTNPNLAEQLKVADQAYGRDDFMRQRGADVVEFFTQLTIAHKQRIDDALSTMGKSCRLAPTVWDSGNSFRIQSAMVHQHADAVSTCSYTKGMGSDPTDERFPFYSQLEDAPRSGWDVPWFEQSSMKGKPHFVYETGFDNRSKYRAEYPMRVAALASIQDWDIICWHVYSGRDDFSRPDPFSGRVDVGHDYLHYRNDEVVLASLKAAGEVFKNRLIAPAPEPTVYTFGSDTLYDPASMDYGRSYGQLGSTFIPTTYRYGSRVVIDPSQEEDVVDGPTKRPDVYISNPVQPNDEITYDWRRSFLKMDSSGAATYVGFFGKYGSKTIDFENSDVTFSEIEIVNPDGMPYPVTPEESYVQIALVSEDGKPLAQTRSAVLTAMSTSFNTGYQLDVTKANQGMHQKGAADEPPREFFGSWVSNTGKEPVLVARVGASVTSPALEGMSYTMYDLNMNKLASGEVEKGGRVVIPAEKPVFFVRFTRGGGEDAAELAGK